MIDRTLLCEILRRSGCPPKYTNLLQLLHDGMEARVMVGSLGLDSFKVSRGVKQGCALIPVVLTRMLIVQAERNCVKNIM